MERKRWVANAAIDYWDGDAGIYISSRRSQSPISSVLSRLVRSFSHR